MHPRKFRRMKKPIQIHIFVIIFFMNARKKILKKSILLSVIILKI